MYVPVVTLSTEDDNKLLEKSKKVFKRTINGININQKWLLRLKLTT